MSTVPEMFASKVFDDKVMRARLPEKVYQSLHRTIASGAKLNPGPASPPKSTTALSRRRRTAG